jgi:hypothetical protein
MTVGTIAERFWRHVEKGDGCWLWTGARDRDGYGRLFANRRDQRVHRVSYELHHGAIAAGLCVLHYCDTPLCVNPAHLRLGTHRDNMIDRAQRGHAGKLTAEQVLTIRSLKGQQMAGVLAERFNVTTSAIYHIWTGTNWQHLPERPRHG